MPRALWMHEIDDSISPSTFQHRRLMSELRESALAVLRQPSPWADLFVNSKGWKVGETLRIRLPREHYAR